MADGANERGNDPRKKGDDRAPGGFRPPPGAGSGLLLYVMILSVIIFGVVVLVRQSQSAQREEIALSDLYKRIAKNDVESFEVRHNRVTGKYRTPVAKGQAEEFTVEIFLEQAADLTEFTRKFNEDHEPGVKFTLKPGSEFVQLILYQFLPVVLVILVLWYVLARQFRSAGGAGSVLSFGKARAKLHNRERPDVTFDHVAGVDEAKEEVKELVEFLKNPVKFRRLGGRIPRGILLVGPPGCGKTLLAKAIAGEADVPFFSISGSDFIEMFVGVGASRVRDLFRQAKDNSPCIMFLDEIDAVGRRRAIDVHGASAESAQTLNAILVEMDGFETDDSVIVIAATNRPDVLDPALMRPGRFDRQVIVNLPDIRGREAILRVHARKYKLAANVDLRTLARGTPTFSGADLEALLNEAALIATRTSKTAVEMCDLEEARDKVRWGPQRRTMKMTDADRRITAYHESGHALVAHLLPDVDPLHKVSIIPQGMALGLTMSLPEQDTYHLPRRKLEAEMTVLLSGRATEETFCDDVTAGAQSDLDRATDIARSMVCRWGMSESLGPVSYHETDELQFLGNMPMRTRTVSEAMAVKIDEEVSRLVRAAYQRARDLISGHRGDVEIIAQNLLKYEVLYAQDVEDILAGREPSRAISEAQAAIRESAPSDGAAAEPPKEPPDRGTA